MYQLEGMIVILFGSLMAQHGTGCAVTSDIFNLVSNLQRLQQWGC